MAAQMRVLDNVANDDGTDRGIGLDVYTATRGFEIYVGTDASNHPLLYQWVTPNNEVLIATTTLGFGYHTYSLVAGPGDGATANVLVDGSTVATITGVTGFAVRLLASGRTIVLHISTVTTAGSRLVRLFPNHRRSYSWVSACSACWPTPGGGGGSCESPFRCPSATQIDISPENAARWFG